MERLIQQEPQGVVVDIVVTLIFRPSCQCNGNTLLRQECCPWLTSTALQEAATVSPLRNTQRETDRQQLVRNEAKANLPKRGLQGQYAQNLSTTMAKSIPLTTYPNTINSTVSLHTQNLPAPAVLPSSTPYPNGHLKPRTPTTNNNKLFPGCCCCKTALIITNTRHPHFFWALSATIEFTLRNAAATAANRPKTKGTTEPVSPINLTLNPWLKLS